MDKIRSKLVESADGYRVAYGVGPHNHRRYGWLFVSRRSSGWLAVWPGDDEDLASAEGRTPEAAVSNLLLRVKGHGLGRFMRLVDKMPDGARLLPWLEFLE